MDQLSAVLTASIVVLSIVSSLIFAFAEGGPTAALTLPVGLIAWFLGERHEGFALPRVAMNVLGFTAVFMAGYELYVGTIEARLLAGGHLIVYLSWLFLFQAKDPRSVWWLAALSVLQVAVASVLTSAFWFGVALLGWLLLALWTMALFTMQRSAARTLHPSSSAPPDRHALEGAVPLSFGSYCLHGLRPDERFRLLSPRFALSVVGMTICSILVSGLFFLLIPRVWMSRMRLFDDTALAGNRVSGFTERVQLGDIGEIMASDDVALSATFHEYPSVKRMNTAKASKWLGESPLFRARTLERYERGRWDPTVRARGEACTPPSPDQKLVRVDIRLNSGSSPTLFTVGQVVTCDGPQDGNDIFKRRLTGEFARYDEGIYDSYSYQVYSLLEPEEIDYDLMDMVGRWPYYIGSPPVEYRHELLSLPDDLQHVRRITKEILDAMPRTAADDDELRANAILSYLRDSGRFEYTTKAAVDNNRIDPIEDFLINRKKGHCEYFASAMALMLRAASIPSRLVTGFKGGSFEGTNGTYYVKERFAHAWVEARIFNRWVTFDPTPAVRDTRAKAAASEGRSLWAELHEVLVRMWISGVSMNSQQQREQVYVPLQRLGQRTWNRILELRGRFEGIWRTALETIRNPDQWISWRGGLTAFVLLSTLLILYRLFSRVFRKIAAFRRRHLDSDGAAAQVTFYRRFREIVEQAGLAPERSQTAREFSRSVERMLDRQLDEAGLANLPTNIADEFYRVRFGGENLSTIDEDRIERRLWRLESCLSQRATVQSDSP